MEFNIVTLMLPDGSQVEVELPYADKDEYITLRYYNNDESISEQTYRIDRVEYIVTTYSLMS